MVQVWHAAASGVRMHMACRQQYLCMGLCLRTYIGFLRSPCRLHAPLGFLQAGRREYNHLRNVKWASSAQQSVRLSEFR